MKVNNRRDEEIGSLQDYWSRNQIARYSLSEDERVKKAELSGKRKRVMPFMLGLLFGFFVIALCLFAVICTLGRYTYSDPEINRLMLADPEESSPLAYVASLYECGLDGIYLGYYSAQEHIYLEAGKLAVCIDENDFLTDGSRDNVYLATDLSSFVPDTVGTSGAVLVCGGRAIDVFITVRDTVAPTAQPAQDAVYWRGMELVAEHYVTEISDATEVTVAFAQEPVCISAGEAEFSVVVTDEGGNFVVVDCPVTVYEDLVAPIITGAEDRTVPVGSTVAYKQGVAAIDDRDGMLELQVDISQVNATKAGSYNVVYTASDACGNVTSVTVVFTFSESEDAYIDEELARLVDLVLSRITDEDMTAVEKAKAIYNWVHSNVSHIPWVDKSSWKKAAIAGLKTGRGSCFTFYAVSRALLTGAGIPNMMVQKAPMPGRSDHYWNLINCGTGWYHFDATPRVNANFFMKTDAQMLSYSRRHHDSHDFDRSLYPATPES